MTKSFSLAALGLALFLAMPAASQKISANANPPKTGASITPLRLPAPAAGSVRVLLLKSWGVTSGWEDLKTQWQNFGTVPVYIDDSTFINRDFTYADLVASGANVIVLSDPAGFNQQYSPAEIAAVSKYASAGHTVLGTYLVFEYSPADNRALMPVFGLKSGVLDVTAIDNTFTQFRDQGCLFRNIPTTWVSSGFPYSQVPSPALRWGGAALTGGARLVAQSDDATGVVILYEGSGYTGIYISNYPEYYGGTTDLQLLYNAVTCFKTK